MGGERAWERQHIHIYDAKNMIKSLLEHVKRRPNVIPVTEPVNHVASRDLARGSGYLVKEPKAEFSFEIFTSLVKGRCTNCNHHEAFPCESIGCEHCTLFCNCKGCKYVRAQGLCFTMRSPIDIRLKYTIQTTPIFWISNHGQKNISPTSLEVIADTINRFLKQSKNPIILLDGIEYLIFANGSAPVLRFIRDIEEWSILQNAIFILPINPTALDEQVMALIERNLEEISTKKR